MKEQRNRNWFLTINRESSCFTELKAILVNNGSTFKHYAYVLHDKDNEEQPHYHLCLEYKNARTFTQVKAMFDGAHVEEMEYKNMSYQYLIHKNDPQKYQYEIDNVMTLEKDYLMLMLNNNEYDKLDTTTLIEAINSGIHTYTELILKFGLNQVNMYHNLINKLFNEQFEKQLEFKNNEIKRLEKSNRDLFNYLTSLYNVLEDKDIENDFIKEVIMPSIQRMILEDKLKKGEI